MYIVALSYMGVGKKQPDPHGLTCSLVKRALKQDIFFPMFGGFIALFWDFGSFFSIQEERLLQEPLQGMPYLYVHPEITVFSVQNSFNPCSLPQRANEIYVPEHMPYMKRGWPFFGVHVRIVADFLGGSS